MSLSGHSFIPLKCCCFVQLTRGECWLFNLPTHEVTIDIKLVMTPLEIIQAPIIDIAWQSAESYNVTKARGKQVLNSTIS